VFPQLYDDAHDRLDDILDTYHDAGRFEESRPDLIRLLHDYPEFVEAAEHIALSFYLLDDVKTAAFLWERFVAAVRKAFPPEFSPGTDLLPWAVEDNRPVLQLMQSLALARLDMHDYAGSLSLLEELSLLDPARAQELQALFGMLLIAVGRHDEVHGLYKKMNLRVSPEVAYSRALAWLQMGEKEKGIKALADAVDAFPRVAEELSEPTAALTAAGSGSSPLPGETLEAVMFREKYHDIFDAVPDAMKALQRVLDERMQELRNRENVKVVGVPSGTKEEKGAAPQQAGYRSSEAWKARDLLSAAYDTGENNAIINAAKKALEIYPACTQAYLSLAEVVADSYEEALEFYQHAIDSADIDLGPDFRREFEGGFWGLPETRPYMRGLSGKALCLWELGRRDEAVDVYRDIYALNPNDNQGVRYALLNRLIALGKWNEAERFIQTHRDEAEVTFMYSRALVLFHKPGKKVQAKDALVKAFMYNPYVAMYLFGERPMPDVLPEYVTEGGGDEAILYIDQAEEAWVADEDVMARAYTIFLRMKGTLEALIEERDEEDTLNGEIYP
jgi:tetratricopeptide (TPR) repeat protein